MLLWTTHVTEQHLPLLADDQGGRLRRRRGADVRGRPGALPLAGERASPTPGSRRPCVGRGAGRGAQPDRAGRRRRGRAGRGHLDWLVDCASALGAEVLCGPFHQPLGQFTGAGRTEDELGRLAEAHRAMADRAPELTLAVEPLNRFEATC